MSFVRGGEDPAGTAEPSRWRRIVVVSGRHPAVLLRLEASGHLFGSLDQTIEEVTDLYAFFYHELGLGYGARVAE